jgi:arginine decarboxylase-like protein
MTSFSQRIGACLREIARSNGQKRPSRIHETGRPITQATVVQPTTADSIAVHAVAEAFYHKQSHTAPLQEKTSASAPLVASESAQG